MKSFPSAVLLLLAFLVSGYAAQSRPNVLFLIADDLNNALGCYGETLARTPNIDRLAARSVRFDRAYCSYPLCGPSRNSMLTGLYPNATGIHNNSMGFRETIPDHISLPQAFRLAGYFAVRIGKLYHYGVPGSIGTAGQDDPASWEIGFNPAGVDRLEEQPQMFSLDGRNLGSALSWYASPSPDERHTDGLIAREAEWVLERIAQRKDRPFFLAVGFFRPHTPFTAPKDPYFGYHPESKMPVVGDIELDEADIPAPALGSRKKEEEKLTDELRRQARQAYYASISFMDAQVGRVIGALERLGLADNTIIVFTSDHGYHLGEHGLWKKQSLFEEGARVPLIISAPGVSRRGAVVRTPVSHVDLYPTLAELAGVKTPANLQGQSLVPMLKDPATKGRGWALTQVVRGGGGAGKRKAAADTGGARIEGYTLRTDRWRYTEWGEGGRLGRELYDHEKDPRELTNLAGRKEHAKTVQELSRQLAAAVKASLPASGKSPESIGRNWTPVLLREESLRP